MEMGEGAGSRILLISLSRAKTNAARRPALAWWLLTMSENMCVGGSTAVLVERSHEERLC